MLQAEQIQELTRRIAKAVQPERIILFGSYAREKADEDSDVDLLVVAKTPLPPAERYAAIRRLLADFPASFDIIVKTPQEYARWRNVINHIVYFADRYGKVVYEKRNKRGNPAMASQG
jgi:predicted nucleotidyltransferase